MLVARPLKTGAAIFLRKILKACFSGTGFFYGQIEKHLAIKVKPSRKDDLVWKRKKLKRETNKMNYSLTNTISWWWWQLT
jgi:hypothetical protein